MSTYYVGWDVGAWGCAKTMFAASSQDCITILGEDGKLLFAWMGNICDYNQTSSLIGLLNSLIKENKKNPSNKNIIINLIKKVDKDKDEKYIKDTDKLIIAVDAILGMPKQALRLFQLNETIGAKEGDLLNSDGDLLNSDDEWKTFVFRLVERNLHHKSPLSVLKDMLGSQSTKALFTLKRWGFTWSEESFIWKNGDNIALETYPSAASSNVIKIVNEELQLVEGSEIKYGSKEQYIAKLDAKIDDDEKRWLDLNDSLICANIAKEFVKNENELCHPSDNEIDDAKQEGWIWLPPKKTLKTTQN